MFNQEIKEKYIASRTKPVQTQYRSVFTSSEEFEGRFGRDVAEFDALQFAELIESHAWVEPDSVRTVLGAYASYADWYCEETGRREHSLRSYNLSDFPYADKLRKTLTVDAGELRNRILQVYDADSGQAAIAALCFAWMGISKKDMVVLRKEQVDTSAGKIFDTTGGVIANSMPDPIKELLDIYAKTQSAVRVQNQTFTVYADDRGFFIKRMITANSNKAGKPISAVQITEWVGNLHDKYAELFGVEEALPMTCANIQRSGGLYRLHEMAKSGVDVRSPKNADKVRLCLGSNKRNHKDNMLLYDAYLECIGEK